MAKLLSYKQTTNNVDFLYMKLVISISNNAIRISIRILIGMQQFQKLELLNLAKKVYNPDFN